MQSAEISEKCSLKHPSRVAWVDKLSEKLSENGPSPANCPCADFIQSKRESALDEFRSQGFPTTRLEEWKYTGLGHLAKHGYQQTLGSDSRGVELVGEALAGLRLKSACGIAFVFVDGHFSQELSFQGALPHGLTVQPFSRIGEEELSDQEFVSELIERHFDGGEFRRKADGRDNPVYALNTALFQDGLVLAVDKGVDVSSVLEILHISTSRGAESVVGGSDESEVQRATNQLKNLLVLGEGSSLRMVESFCYLNCDGVGGSAYLTNSTMEGVLGQGSALEYLRVQNEGPEAVHLSNLLFELKKDSSCEIYLSQFGGALTRNDIETTLVEPGAFARINGVNVLSGNQHVDNNTLIDHASAHCQSSELIRGVYGGRSRGVFSGTIVVREDAQKTNSYQSNSSILLSQDASSDSRPQLKIFADDVKCSHGATVGQFDEEALFYLRARGIDLDTARQMLSAAFLAEVSEPLKDKALREHMLEILERRIAEVL